MRKYIILSMLIFGLIFVSTQAGAYPYDTLVGYTNTDDLPYDKYDKLPNANPDTETDWAKMWVGNVIDSFEFIKFEDDEETPVNEYPGLIGVNKIVDYNPGFAWEYAIVKYGQWHALFQDAGDDDILNVPDPDAVVTYTYVNRRGDTIVDDLIKEGEFRYGVSHVDFFKTTQVPEPASMLMLGLGLLGVAGLSRKLKNR